MAFAPAAQRSIARLLGRSRPAACPRLIIECNTTPQFPHSWAASSLLPLLPARTRAPAIRPFARRFQTTSASSSTSTQNEQSASREEAPAYEMTFTCKVCETRSTHRISKQGYHHGTVLIQCPGCKNRHLMADHLKVWEYKSVEEVVMLGEWTLSSQFLTRLCVDFLGYKYHARGYHEGKGPACQKGCP